MLNPKQRKALDLLFALTPEETARRLSVAPEVVQKWLAQTEFAGALRQRCHQRRETAQRIAVEATLAAARRVESALSSGDDKGLNRLLFDLLKISGVFNESSSSEAGDSDLSLAALIAEARRGARSAPDGDDE